MAFLNKADERIRKFKEDLKKLETVHIVRRHILFGDSFLLESDSHYDLKKEIAENFSIHPSEVIMVGSAKLGFSIAFNKRYRVFCDSSDIDMVLLSPSLFDKIWKEVYSYESQKNFWPESSEFKEYLFKGWIRPDKLPKSDIFTLGNEWFEFFRGLTSSGRYGRFNIRAGLYKDWHFLEGYQSICVEQCKFELKETS